MKDALPENEGIRKLISNPLMIGILEEKGEGIGGRGKDEAFTLLEKLLNT